MSTEYIVMPKSDYVSACDTIRSKTGSTEPIKSSELVEKTEIVYQAGYEQGKSEGGTSNDNYYDIFWDAFQQNGERTNYTNAFGSPTIRMYIWTDENFAPKYDMSPTTMSDMFKYSDIQDVKGILERLGRKFDTSQCTNFTFAFRDSAVTYLPVLDLSGVGTLNCTFMNSTKLKALHLKNMHTNVGCASNTFLGCNSLTDVMIEGEIGLPFDIKWSPLNAESAKSIITHLVNYAGTDKEFTYSVLFADSVWELLNAEGATAPGNVTWEEYVNSIGWNK